jgi:membrane fusion protein (multidrug efflux system)
MKSSALWIVVLCLMVLGCEQLGLNAQTPTAKKKKPPGPHLVEVAPVDEGALRSVDVFTGSLRHRQTVRIFTQEEGRIVAMPYFEGDRISAGTLIARLDDSLLTAELIKARALSREAEVNLKRLRRLRASRAVAEDELLRGATELEVTKAEQSVLESRLGYTSIAAPFDGVVSARLAEPGDFVDRNTHIMSIANPSSLVTELSVSEMVLPHVKAGDQVSVKIDALGDRPFPGRVLRVHPELNQRTRRGIVEAELAPVPQGARAGQFARIEFATEALDRKIIPFAAVRLDREGEFVFRVGSSVDAKPSKVASVRVRTGRRLGDKVEVLDGLETGDRVVVRGFLGLNDGKPVKVVERDES